MTPHIARWLEEDSSFGVHLVAQVIGFLLQVLESEALEKGSGYVEGVKRQSVLDSKGAGQSVGQSTRGAGVSVDLPTLSVKATAGATPGFNDKFGSVAPFAHPRTVNLVGGSSVVGMQVEDLVI